MTLKNMFLCVSCAILVLIGCAINFVLHELSHFIALILCSGHLEAMSFGVSSFVGGYVAQQYIPFVAISSVVVPSIIVAAIYFVHNLHVRCFVLGFTIPNIMNCALGLFAVLFVNDQSRPTYDVALAFDHAVYPCAHIAITLLSLCVNLVISKKVMIQAADDIGAKIFT